MSRDVHDIWGKISIVLLVSLTLSLALPAHASNKAVVLFPLSIYTDKPSDYLRQGVRSMLASRLSGGGLEVISDEALESLLARGEAITSKEHHCHRWRLQSGSIAS